MNTFDTEIKNLLDDKTLRFTAERLVLKCGIRADLKGFPRLADAVILYGTEQSQAFCEIYRMIGDARGIKAKSVLREISYAIANSLDIASRLSAMLGISVRQNDVHCSMVIAYLGKLFKAPDESLYA